MRETTLLPAKIAGTDIWDLATLPKPPTVELMAAVPLNTKPANGRIAPGDFSGLMPGLAQYLRPQAAFQWWTLPYLSAITPQYVQQVLIGGLAGMHVACWQMFDLMLDTNPEIAACVGELVDGITSKKLLIEPYHEEDQPPSANAVRNQKIVAAALRNMVPEIEADENALKQTIRDIVFGRFHGQSILEIDYYEADDPQQLHTLDVANIGTIIAPRATFWVHPVCYAWDVTGRLGLRVPIGNLQQVSKTARAAKVGSLPTDFGTSNALSFIGYQANPRPSTLARFPKNQFLISIIKAKTGSALGASCLRPLAGWWVFENFSADFAMDLAQIFGIPFRTAYFEPGTTDADKQFVMDMLQNMGSRGWALLPSTVKLDFEKAMATGAESPQGFLIKLCHEQYRKVILRQTMTGSGHGGASSGSKAGMTAEQDVKAVCIQSGADYAADVLREQFARAILRLNVGDDSELPFIRLSEEDEGSLADMQRDQIGAQLIDLGENYFRRKYNYPKPSPGEPLAKNAPAAPANGAPKPGESGKPGGAGGAAPQPDEEMNAVRERVIGSQKSVALQSAAAENPKLNAQLSTGLAEMISPLVKYLKKGLAITDPEAQREFFLRAIAKWPELTAPLQHDKAVADALTPELVKSFVAGLQAKPSTEKSKTSTDK